MHSIYEDKRIPLQIRRFLIFDEICKLAKKTPDEIIHLSFYSQIAFGVVYSKRDKKYTAFGSVFKYAHTRQEVVEQGVDKLPHDEYVMCAITVKRQAFTKAVRTPFGLLINWNNYISNRLCCYLDNEIKHFFPVNDELELDYPPHRFHERLVANTQLPLWSNKII